MSALELLGISSVTVEAVCTDLSLLRDLTEQVLEAPIRSMIPFDEKDISDYTANNKNDNAKIKEASLVAWERADAVVQKAEFVLRGYAAEWLGGPGCRSSNNILHQHNPTSTKASVSSHDDLGGLTVGKKDMSICNNEHHDYLKNCMDRDHRICWNHHWLDPDEILELLESGNLDAQDHEDIEEGEELVFDTFEDFQKDVEDFARSEGLLTEDSEASAMDDHESDRNLETEEATNDSDAIDESVLQAHMETNTPSTLMNG